jgi:hypothetical protein
MRIVLLQFYLNTNLRIWHQKREKIFLGSGFNSVLHISKVASSSPDNDLEI